jgi:cyclophilin family peptidyl-prolyl cis-trans isomerase
VLVYCSVELTYAVFIGALKHILFCLLGMVGWAGGGHGPDFFIVTHSTPVDWWEHQHTVWGMIRDESSLEVVERMYELPAEAGGGMRMLRDKIQFRIELF